jgi:SAM-dependent methyltransferase
MNNSGFQQDDENTIRYFTDLVAQNGIDPRSLDWGSRESQHLRFSVLAGIGSLQGAHVLDVGCGLGDFYEWLREQGYECDYHGIDITTAMISTARERFPDVRFDIGTLTGEMEIAVGEYDYVLASGIFYRRQMSAEGFMHRMLGAMYAHSRRGIAFNSLSLWAPDQETGEFYADPLATLEFCRTLTPWVVLRHDYHLRDFTIYLYRERQAS